jgi:8-oxo-dGTP pyrophosphatase MutT (NUDIX family)
MHAEIWKPNTVVAAVLERDGRFLCIEEVAPTVEGERVVYNQPAGHLDPGETLLDAVRRETLEESGWHMEPVGLIGIYLIEPPGLGVTFLRFCFHGRLLRHDADRVLDRGILRTVWLTRDELAAEHDRHRSPLVLRCVDDYLAEQRFPLDLIHDLRFG